MTRNEFNEKYTNHDIEIDRDFELRIDNCFKVSDINLLEEAINDYEKLINEMPQVVKDWLLG
ncbi:hypothetical protein [Spiroplasma endosymbiont of Virgichneumon dumeticola]|uniref:hypothetical protein n=1 Tax=Spiroplasma endosymbiont of Virgichneumon dumeticola TaxID=3139323 RepID=UPI0035C8834A